jgi:hypothetical protein
VDEVTVQFTEAGYEVEVAERSQVKNKLDDVWRTVAND